MFAKVAVLAVLLVGCATYPKREAAMATVIVMVPASAIVNVVAGRPFNAFMEGR